MEQVSITKISRVRLLNWLRREMAILSLRILLRPIIRKEALNSPKTLALISGLYDHGRMKQLLKKNPIFLQWPASCQDAEVRRMMTPTTLLAAP
jgi:hypothetical protein